MEVERQIHRYEIIAILKESKKRAGEEITQLNKYKIISITKE